MTNCRTSGIKPPGSPTTGSNPDQIPHSARLIWATVASWSPASTEFGWPVQQKFSLPRRFFLPREALSAVCRLRISRYATHFRADEPVRCASDLPEGCRAPCLRPSFPATPFLPVSEPLFSPSCATTVNSNFLAIRRTVRTPKITKITKQMDTGLVHQLPPHSSCSSCSSW
jgi:hypothetical protein